MGITTPSSFSTFLVLGYVEDPTEHREEKPSSRNSALAVTDCKRRIKTPLDVPNVQILINLYFCIQVKTWDTELSGNAETAVLYLTTFNKNQMPTSA